MQYRKYGKLGYDVSALGMGCMRLPKIIKGDYAEVDREKAYEIIRYSVNNGINYFDTAYGYHGTTSEEVLGEALDNGMREKVKIVTKQPLGVMKTQDDIRRNLENTLKKLHTDYIDVYLIHNIQARSWDEIKRRKIYEEYEKFRAEGLIRAIGFSYHGEFPVFSEVLAYYPWDMCQVQQNLIDTDKEVTAEAIEIAGKKGTALVIMEPLRGGGLVNAPAPVKEVYDSAPEKRSPAEWAFKHLVDYPQVSTIISGMSTMEQLIENIEIFSKPDFVPGVMTTEQRDVLARAKAAYESIVTIPCTGCEYCMPCPQNVSIPGIFTLYNDGMMFGDFNQPKRSYMFTSSAGYGADKCVECGECEAKCPQHLKIVEALKVAHEALNGWIE